MTKRIIKGFNSLVNEAPNQMLSVRELLASTTYRRELFDRPVRQYQTVSWHDTKIPDLNEVMADDDGIRGFVKGFKDKGKITPTIVLTNDGPKLANGHTSLMSVCYQSVIGVRSDITPDTELDCKVYTLKGEFSQEKLTDALDALLVLENARIETDEKTLARLILKKACTVKAASAACESVQSICSVSKAKGVIYRAVLSALDDNHYGDTADALRAFCNTQSKQYKVLTALMETNALEQLSNSYDIDVAHDDIEYEAIHIEMVEFMGTDVVKKEPEIESDVDIVEAEIVDVNDDDTDDTTESEPGRESGKTLDEVVKIQFGAKDVMGIVKDMADHFKGIAYHEIEESGNMSEMYDYGQYLCWLTMLGWEGLSYAEVLAKLDKHSA